MKKSIFFIVLFGLFTIYPTQGLNSKEKRIKQLEQQIEDLKKNHPDFETTAVAGIVRVLEKQVERLRCPKGSTSSRRIDLAFPPLPTKKPKVGIYDVNSARRSSVGNIRRMGGDDGDGGGGGESIGSKIVYGVIISVIVSTVLSVIGFIYHKATSSEAKAKRNRRRRAY